MQKTPRKIEVCRISGSKNLIPVLNLGEQELTGVFPKTKHTPITKGPLELVVCPDSGLLQLHHSYDAEEMYGNNYGYRSSLNPSMVKHLQHKVNYLSKFCPVTAGALDRAEGIHPRSHMKAY